MFSVSRDLGLKRLPRNPCGFVYNGVVVAGVLEAYVVEKGLEGGLDFYRLMYDRNEPLVFTDV